ncbi:MAG: SUMF1/EgtB/PvdO family nonheme iron enzyme [Anaerolineae bacterium]|nr:SUMF1/EgtB/PvdO family nonheme iron enzyme [Anaerolineae bacterium]
MKLFISYSRSMRQDVQAVIGLLKKAGHKVWWDGDIPVIADWWATILDKIEWCNVFIFVVSEKAVQSPYCLEELKYATECHRPILPLLLDDHTHYKLPPEVTPMRQQWLEYDGKPENMLAEITRSCNEIDWKQVTDMAKSVRRPAEPNTGSGSVTRRFQQAINLAKEGHFEETKKRLRDIASLDKKRWKKVCEAWIQRINLYAGIVELADDEVTLSMAQEDWQKYLELSDDLTFDPFDIAAKVTQNATKPIVATVATIVTPPQPKPAPKPDIKTILPAPFGWIKIPKGSVTIKGKTETLPTFEIAKYPITNLQFKQFIAAKGYENKDWWTAAGWDVRKKKKWTEPRYWDNSKWNGDLQPVVGVSWYEAVAFCNWLNKQINPTPSPSPKRQGGEQGQGGEVMLPTEQQWQRAAQALPNGGDSGYAYPWGNDWDCERCNNSVKPCDSNVTTAVTLYEGKGDSPCGVVDMAGNVWEWCRTAYKTGNQDINETDVRVLRGGSWGSFNSDYFRCDYRNYDNPFNWLFNFFGFRCVRS